MVGKYGAIALVQIQNWFEYRTNIVLKFIRPLFITLFVSAIWLTIFALSGRSEIGGFTSVTFIVYLLVIRFIATATPGHAAIESMNLEVRNGDIALRLIKPFHYLLWLFFRNSPIPAITGVVGMVAVVGATFVFGVALPTGWLIPLFIFSFIGGVLLWYAIYQGLGVLSFWMYEVYPAERFYRNLHSIVSGEILPLTLFGAFAPFLMYLPFSGMAFTPGALFVGLFSVREALKLVVVQWIWVIVLWLGVIFLYHRGVKKFEAQGG